MKKQMMVMEGCLVKNSDDPEGNLKGLQEFLDKEFAGVKYVTEIKTQPTPGEEGTGGRNDVIMEVPSEIIGKIAIKRLGYGLRWFEDVVLNAPYIYSKDIIDKYYSWNKEDLGEANVRVLEQSTF